MELSQSREGAVDDDLHKAALRLENQPSKFSSPVHQYKLKPTSTSKRLNSLMMTSESVLLILILMS